MDKIKKIWLRINNKRTLNKGFTAEYYLDLINRWKEKFGFIDFHSEGSEGILLRHDIDADLDKSVRMAEIEAGRDGNLNRAMFEHGDHSIVESTFFALNTAKYWESREMGSALRYIQSLGHEVGWHNNAITDHLKTGKDIDYCVRRPLEQLRDGGLAIKGSAAHGDRLCYKYRYHNYNIFGFKSPGWDFWNVPPLDMAKYGLQYEAYHVPFTGWLADCHTGWNGNIKEVMRWNPLERHQIIIHPQNWRI
jgi:hypothetical protein